MGPQEAHLVFILATLSLVQTVVCSETGQTVECTEGNITAVVSPVEPSLSLTCGGASVRGTPTADGKLYRYSDKGCNAEAGQSTETTLEELGARGSWSAGKLSVTKFPTKNTKVCLLCTSANTVTCSVAVDIAKEAASCSESGENAEEVALTLAENQTVYFKCPRETDQLNPQEKRQAFDGDCSQTQQLPAELERRDSSEANAYSLTLAKSRKAASTFCYKCIANAEKQNPSESCFIKVTTKTTTQHATPAPSDPPTSGTVIPNVSSAFACGAASVLALKIL